ncbi:MAG: hypothetical protein NXH75_16335, partial [Halobacteriovoraceae bacterium]|nr:hypothetical protein [Halobacteriovoraceae bacterium]
MKVPKVFLSRHIKLFAELSDSYTEFRLEMPSEGDLKPLTRDFNDYQGLISTLSDPIDRDFLKKSKTLKVISNFAVGYNNIDVDSAKELSISVGNTPNTLTHSTAELALTLLLMSSRRTHSLQEKVLKGEWTQWEPEIDNGFDLRKTCIGIIGFGRIGQAFAKMAYDLWKCEIIIWPRESAKKTKCDFPFEVVSKEEFFRKTNVLSLHCPLSSETHKLIDEKFISRMNHPFHFINTARGACHDEEALLKYLNQGKIIGAGLDVTDPEPMNKNSPLLKKKNVVVLPHIGSATDKTRRDMAIQCLENIKAGLKG